MTSVAPPLIDFSPLGDLYNTYRQGQQRAKQEQALQQFAQNGQQFDPATRQLIAANPQLGMSLAQLALSNKRDERDFGYRQQQDLRAQGNADRSFGLQQQQAAEAARGFDYREVDDGSGGKTLIRINKATGASERVPIDGAQATPNNPFAQPGKMNDEQGKAALYTSRMMKSEQVLRSIDAEVATNPVDKFRGAVSDRIGYNIRSPEYQKFDQARRDFVNATLRRESGAVISEQEFANANQQYFPQPGDTKELIAQKRQNRMEAIRGIGAGAGRGYQPEMSFDPSGEIVPNPGSQPAKKAGPVRVASPAEAARLPKGTRFLDPNGVERIVP